MAKKSLLEKAKREPKYKVRKYNRCPLTGRAKGYMRYFGISRIQFREMAHKGLLPGVRKASW